MKKTISILGSTGSVGLTTLEIIRKKKNLFKIDLLSANQNYKLICKQIKEYEPKIFVINNSKIFKKIKKGFEKKNIKIFNNFDLLKFKKKSDITISAIPGLQGLKPTISMIKLSKKLLVANKESIICGWNIIKKIADRNKVKIIPVDSEHFSILKIIENSDKSDIKKIYLTASGGPFLKFKPGQFKNIQPRDAIKHPKWKMGKKISIDSSTLMNKILELIEAQKLFNIPLKKLEILIHPESLVHAIVVFKNGLTKFIYHDTSMIIPISNGIFDDKVDINDFYKNKSNSKINSLNFFKVDQKIFPIIKIKNRLNEFYSTPIIINAANEVAVDQFLQKKIPFLGIIKFIMSILKDRNYKKYAIRKPKNIKQIINIFNWTKSTIMKKVK